MAKLKAHGLELLRVALERDVEDASSSITWQRVTRAYFADGKILQKQDVKWKPDTYHPNGELYSYGWKLFAKAKPGVTAEQMVETATRKIREKGSDTKWKIITGGAPVCVISQERIMRAVESGDSLGFCKECGAEHDGVEPDARNYRCDSCGAMAVYGAEEMLIA